MTQVVQQSLIPTESDRFDLLESGEQFFPAILASIAAARSDILIETFILFEDAVGTALQRELVAAAQRGVQIDLTLDGYGSPSLSEPFLQTLVSAGIRIHIYDPRPPLLGLRTNIFRRLHRKLAVIDCNDAYVGGINYAVDQLAGNRPNGKLDFTVRTNGPIVQSIYRFMRDQIDTRRAYGRRQWRHRRAHEHAAATSLAQFVVRDNDAHRDDIERHYRLAIHSAKREIILCNAYFFPGYRLLSALRRAARRGVTVSLILQGSPDMPQVKLWETLLYAPLLQAGVKIYEYRPHPLHAKVAVVDQRWATVGSSNLDPLSLTLNLEANLVIHEPLFCQSLHGRLEQILQRDCNAVLADKLRRHRQWPIVLQTAAYHFTRHFPKWAGWLPAHIPKMHSLRNDRQSGIQRRLLNGEGAQ
jgi:cardiolipin synthase